MSKQRIPLGTVLLNKGLIDKRTLEKALKMQKQKKNEGRAIPLGELLVRAGKITKEQLEEALNRQSKRTTEVLRSRYEIEEIHGQLTIQSLDTTTGKPFVEEAYSNAIQVAENLKNEPVILVTPEFQAEARNVMMTIRQRVLGAYGNSNGQPALPQILKVTPDLLDLYRTSVHDPAQSAPKSDVESEFEVLVKKAYEMGAVDLHFFRKVDVCTVRLRINGSLRTFAEWSPERADKIISVGFQSFGKGSKYSNWNQRQRQRIRIKIRYNQHITLDCRYEHAPGDDGAYHTCVRILGNDKREVSKQIDLCDLGFTRKQHYALEAAVSEPSGLVILAGPTGSGKSTTMAGLIKFINQNNDVNVLTVESPIERELPAFQTSVSDDEEGNQNEFAHAIKSMLRRDPDVGMVGEIRDHMSASAVASGVQTGHIMLSTVHAQSAIEIVERLASPAMKLTPDTIGSPSFVNALVFQMLVPTLDPNSKVRLTRDNLDDYMEPRQRERFLSLFPDFHQKELYVRGSSDQHPEGVNGMTICAEIVIPDDRMRSHFRRLELADALRYWKSLGVSEANKPLDERLTGLTASEHAILKVEQGLVDPRDLEAYFGHMNILAAKRKDVAANLDRAEAA